MYPLDKDFTGPISEFIDRLHQYDHLQVRTNTMSTQVFGDYDHLMASVSREMKRSFEKHPSVVMVLKVINSDLE